MQFERDPETSDTANDVQFQVIFNIPRHSRKFAPIPWPPLPYTPPGDGKGREFGYKSESSLRGGSATTCCQVSVSTKRRENRIKYVYFTEFVNIVLSRFPCGSTDSRN